MCLKCLKQTLIETLYFFAKISLCKSTLWINVNYNWFKYFISQNLMYNFNFLHILFIPILFQNFILILHLLTLFRIVTSYIQYYAFLIWLVLRQECPAIGGHPFGGISDSILVLDLLSLLILTILFSPIVVKLLLHSLMPYLWYYLCFPISSMSL